MKVSINQVKINRVGINTAQVRGIRLSSAVADRGHKVDFPFSDSLVDYWNFGGKYNFDKDITTVTGLLGNVLTAYNFGWSLMSGYGGYNENYLKYKKAANVFVTDDHSITIMNFVPANNWVVSKYSNSALKSTKIKVAGLTSDDQLEYGYSPSNEGARVMMPIPKDGIYDLPESVVNQSTYSIGFFLSSALTKNVTIEQIPLYEGAIVTDGVDDYLKLDKVGYKVGTVIIKHKPVRLFNGWQYVLETSAIRTYMVYNFTDENINTNFDNYNTVGDYGVGIINTPRLIETPFYIGCQSKIKEFLSMALYSIAIYDRALSDKEVQEVINFINYGTTNPIFALNFDNFAYKAVDYPDFATGKVTTNKIVVDSTTETFNGAIAVAMNPEADTGDPIEVPFYKIKVTGLNQYSVGEGNWAVGLMGMMIDSTKDPWTYSISKDGVYDIPAISLSDGIYNLGIMAQIAIDKPIEIEVLYDKNVTKSFPENKQIFP
ncbi:hypothetical protein H3T19_04575 [Bacteroides fragilis]|uniref:hypothetical protein n=1 Tax=Bacteroides fragilis TaxID=817 RepID=UPI0015F5E6F1|nr:hypothetical protein [Bacteroides fragilis]MBA5650028.1 hypothetical protein [Bacteroides fragilis]